MSILSQTWKEKKMELRALRLDQITMSGKDR